MKRTANYQGREIAAYPLSWPLGWPRTADDDRALHDHPWINISIVLSGGYVEVLPDLSDAGTPHELLAWRPVRRVRRRPGSIVFRWPTSAHRLEVEHGRPCWTLFLTGPVWRRWGFHCPQGWRYWREFTDPATNGATVGRGCD